MLLNLNVFIVRSLSPACKKWHVGQMFVAKFLFSLSFSLVMCVNDDSGSWGFEVDKPSSDGSRATGNFPSTCLKTRQGRRDQNKDGDWLQPRNAKEA